ncbi:MAG: protein disulfide oxidoreductase [Mycobacterium sp.]
MKHVRSFGLVVAAVALIAGCGGAPTTGQQASGTPPEQNLSARHPQAAAEQLQFTVKTLDGKDFSGQSLSGKPAVLWFWAPWCPVCQREAPSVAKAAHANPKVTFVGVAAQDEVSAMKDFVAKYQMGSFTQLADVDASVWQRFGVTAQPAFAFIAPDGSVQVVKGAMSEQDLAERLGTLAGV